MRNAEGEPHQYLTMTLSGKCQLISCFLSMTVNQTGEYLLKWQVPLGCRSRTFQFPSVA